MQAMTANKIQIDYKASQDASIQHFHKQAFDAFDPSPLSEMTDKQLAAFQSDYPNATPQYILAQQEWQTRLVARQVKGAYRSAWIGVIGAVVGAIIGSLLTLLVTYLSSNSHPH